MKPFFYSAQSIVTDLIDKLGLPIAFLEVVFLTDAEMNEDRIVEEKIFLNIDAIENLEQLEMVLLHEIIHVALAHYFPLSVTRNEQIVDLITQTLLKEYFPRHA